MEMQGKHYLKVAALGRYPELEITKDEYNSILKARATLTAALDVEEKYDLVLGNFLDLEKDLLNLTVEKIIDHRFDYNRAYTLTNTLNRRIVNFILSGKNYTELIASKASKCATNEEDVKEAISSLKSKHYDQNLDYRLMEALRNHVSHSGVAVHQVDNPDKWLMNERKEATHLVFNIGIYALKERLSSNPSFKASVLKELPEKIDLKKAARSYLGAISSIHEEVRRTIKSGVDDARSLIEKYLNEYAKINNGECFAVGAYSPEIDSSGEKPTILLLSWDDVRISLQEKNHSIANMEKRHVSSALL
ncbi:hypothetical protein [Pseudomonas denitrificans (nom. rej.)]|uniref:Uncharacterized protein n=1 Tax=Pseudomonas denitrificans TaxID=43306 RepID=A0A9X7N125_PSEDE|nr:hypothetical protein [Pseudomonas denitrificans (nom. rej.)]QEY73064.1 hypothetical protein F1C79_16465 [Pseudomonas denitrificans (nom. rej.)]